MNATYFILADHGKFGASWVERDVNETDRATTVADLMDMQIDDPVAVFCAEDGHWSDVSEDVAREIAGKHEALHPKLIEFIELHAGTRLANELVEDAA
jgi:hypothetical protein